MVGGSATKPARTVLPVGHLPLNQPEWEVPSGFVAAFTIPLPCLIAPLTQDGALYGDTATGDPT